MADTTPRLGYPLIGVGNITGYVTANEATQQNDAIVQASVLSRTLTAPPGSPAEGDTYIVAASPTGAWAGHALAVAEYVGGAWLFYAPTAGWWCYVQAEALYVYYTGAAWTPFTASATSSVNLDATGVVPTTGSLPDGFVTFRYTPGGLVTLYARNGASILALVLGTPA